MENNTTTNGPPDNSLENTVRQLIQGHSQVLTMVQQLATRLDQVTLAPQFNTTRATTPAVDPPTLTVNDTSTAKLEPLPKFDGSKFKHWTWRARLKTRMRAQPSSFAQDAYAIEYITGCLTGKALDWALAQTSSSGFHGSLTRFLTEFDNHFTDTERLNRADAAFENFKQNSRPIDDHIIQWELLKVQSSYAEDLCCDKLIKSLNPDWNRTIRKALLDHPELEFNYSLLKSRLLKLGGIESPTAPKFVHDDPMDVSATTFTSLPAMPLTKLKEWRQVARKWNLCFCCHKYIKMPDGTLHHLSKDCPEATTQQLAYLEAEEPTSNVNRGQINSYLLSTLLESYSLASILPGPAKSLIIQLNLPGYGQVSALVDSGAQGFAYISTDICKRLHIPVKSKKYPKILRSFQGVPVDRVEKETASLTFEYFNTDGPHKLTATFDMVSTLKHDIILGYSWMAENHAILDFEQNQLLFFDGPTWIRLRQMASKLYKSGKKHDKRQQVLDASTTTTLDCNPSLANITTNGQISTNSAVQKIDFKVTTDRVSTPEIMPSRHKLTSNPAVSPVDETTRQRRKLRKPVQSVKVAGRYRPRQPSRQQREVEFMVLVEQIDANTGSLSSVPAYLQDVADVFKPALADQLPPERPGFDMKLELKPGSTLPSGRIYRLSNAEEAQLEEEIRKGLSSGKIIKSQASTSSPVLFVKKPNSDKLRMCVDYRQVNAATKSISATLPLIDNLLSDALGSNLYSKIDLKGAFNLLGIDKDSESLTAFKTKHGLYQYRVIPFGLKNGPTVFQEFMNSIFPDLKGNGMDFYLDDLLIYEPDPVKHKQLLHEILQRLLKNKLAVSLDKCQFMVPEVDFLGHHLSEKGLSMQEAKVFAISSYPTPKNLKQLQSFLGMCGYYHMFIPNYSTIVSPLLALTKKGAKFDIDSNCQKAISALKDAFVSGPILAQADPTKHFYLQTDASDFAMGAVLMQQDSPTGKLRPIGFYSRKFTPAEINYTIYDKELLAIVDGLSHWRYLLVDL